MDLYFRECFQSTMGTQTDIYGAFTMPQAVTGNAVVYVTSIGYTPYQSPINANTGRLRIVMKAAESELAESVITGYSSKKISEITGSVQTYLAKKSAMAWQPSIPSLC